MPAVTARRLHVLGTRGIPNQHGGFEAFAERLAPWLADARVGRDGALPGGWRPRVARDPVAWRAPPARAGGGVRRAGFHRLRLEVGASRDSRRWRAAHARLQHRGVLRPPPPRGTPARRQHGRARLEAPQVARAGARVVLRERLARRVVRRPRSSPTTRSSRDCSRRARAWRRFARFPTAPMPSATRPVAALDPRPDTGTASVW